MSFIVIVSTILLKGVIQFGTESGLHQNHAGSAGRCGSDTGTSGKKLGTSQTMYARYERGANELPIRHLLKLCEIYSVTSDFFLGKDQTRRDD